MAGAPPAFRMSKTATHSAARTDFARPGRLARRELRFALFLALSLVVHGVALVTLAPKLRPVAFDDAAERGVPLVARVERSHDIAVPDPAVEPPSAATAPAPPPPSRSTPPTSNRREAPRVLDAPASPLALPREPLARVEPPRMAPLHPSPPLSMPPAPEQATEGYPDLTSYVAARRQARGEPADGVEDDNARRDRLVARNLASVNAPTFGASRNTGGLFQVTRLGYDDAEFTFFGWHSEIKRRAQQRIEVRRGNERDIRVAVVRRMIAIIREYEQEDFTWRSSRLGRDIRLSARVSDSAGLEDFLMREFFL